MSDFPRAGFPRRLASLVYDGLAVIAFAMLTTVAYLLLIQAMVSGGLIAMGEAEDISALIQNTPVLYTLRSVLLIAVGILFFGYFWVKGGQTIGMRAWRLKVQNLDGSKLSWKQAIIRAFAALLGLGNLLLLVNLKDKRALQDYLAGTEMVTLSKEENKRIYRERH